MKITLVLIILEFSVIKAKHCISDGNKRCWLKNELGPYGIFVKGGDPCFEYHGRRVCFISKGMLHPCTCTKECGCGQDVQVVQSCPSGSKPKPDDCSDQRAYCALGEDNTMCQFCGVRSSCADSFCANELSNEDIREIVDKHNQLRARVANGNQPNQPSATDMKKLKWDLELARIAQRWADQCPGKPPHDTNRKSLKFSLEPGQNRADTWTSAQKNKDWQISKKIQSWYNEVYDFPAKNVGAFSTQGATGTIGHYAQMVWGETEFIGCGAMYYKDDNYPRFPYRKVSLENILQQFDEFF